MLRPKVWRRSLATALLSLAIAMVVGTARRAEGAIDMTGNWFIDMPPDVLETFGVHNHVCFWEVVQTGTAVSMSGPCKIFGTTSLSGTIDVDTGVYSVVGTSSVCSPGAMDAQGTAALNSISNGTFHFDAPTCVPTFHFPVTGHRAQLLEGPFGDSTCQDGIDNDNDTFLDAADPGCAPFHEGPPGDSTCSDGLDNDDDGSVDGSDRGCQADPPEVCNGFDDNVDGQIDEGFPNADGDALADCVDLDQDNDFVNDGEDNCLNKPNGDQLDSDNDGIGDACDPDTLAFLRAASTFGITIDGQFEPAAGEWSDVPPIAFLSGDAQVHTALDSGLDAIYLAYDFSLSTNPLAVGDEVGPVTFQVGNGSVFDVYIIQGGLDTNFGPHPVTSAGGVGDHVRVLLNGLPFDNSAGCVVGAVDFNTTSPNFPGLAHNVAELEVRLTGNPGGCYSPEPAFWSATLPGVRPLGFSARGSNPRSGGTNEIFTVSESFVSVSANTGITWLFPVGADVCPPSPDASCLLPAIPAKASVLLKSKTKVVPNDKSQLAWKWDKGAATTASDFGDPVTTDGYALCVYDGSGLVAEADVPHGGTCAGRPCWTGNSGGFKYKDKDLTADGISEIVLKAGLDTKARITVKAKGARLPMPNLASLTSPLKVQLRKVSGGPCWGAVYTFPPAQKNDASQFKDKAD